MTARAAPPCGGRRLRGGGDAVVLSELQSTAVECRRSCRHHGPDRHRIGDSIPHRAAARHFGVLATQGQPQLVPAAAGRFAVRFAARYCDIFSIAFAPAFGFVDGVYGAPDGSLGFPAPFLSLGPEVPLWFSLATGDFLVKFLAALLLLAPYRMLMGRLMPLPPLRAAA